MRDDTSSENYLGSKDIIYQPVMSIFSWAILVKFFQKSGGVSPPELIIVIVIIELWYVIDLCLELFNITLISNSVLFYETLFPY